MDYTAAEFRDFVCEEIDATVASWREQARMEEKRGAASQALIGTVLWGAERFETLKAQILSLPTEFVSVPSSVTTTCFPANSDILLGAMVLEPADEGYQFHHLPDQDPSSPTYTLYD